ncbi:MAG: hypothetical protein IKP64_03375, partial [Selenomonadaceae bacterium]|nr:hypothetical protein [Selenomonadaceae bacterium]
MTDTFFDLQRFANPVLEGTDTGFEWDSGEFVGGVNTANVGTQSNPAYWAETGGVSAVEGSEVYLTGKPPQAFSLDGKPDWSIALGDDNTLQVTKAGTSLALGTWSGTDTAVLAINGEYAESTGTFSNIYIKSTGANIVSLNAAGYTVGEGADGVLVGLDGEKAGMVNFAGNNSNISLASGTDTASADIVGGFGFEKYAEAYNAKGDIGIWTDSNTITLPAGNVLALKVTDPLLTGSATLTKDAVTGATGGATLTTSTGLSGFTINGTTWNEFAGNLSTIEFDSVGAATVNNSGAVTVDGAKGAQVTIKNLDTAGAFVNGLEVAADRTEATPQTLTVGFTLDTAEGSDGEILEGISAIDVSKAPGKDVQIVGGYSGDFDVVAAGGASYNVAATIAANDYILFNATASQIEIFPSLSSNYNVTGGDAKYTFAPIQTYTKGTDIAASLEGADISYKLGSNL